MKNLLHVGTNCFAFFIVSMLKWLVTLWSCPTCTFSSVYISNMHEQHDRAVNWNLSYRSERRVIQWSSQPSTLTTNLVPDSQRSLSNSQIIFTHCRTWLHVISHPCGSSSLSSSTVFNVCLLLLCHENTPESSTVLPSSPRTHSQDHTQCPAATNTACSTKCGFIHCWK